MWKSALTAAQGSPIYRCEIGNNWEPAFSSKDSVDLFLRTVACTFLYSCITSASLSSLRRSLSPWVWILFCSREAYLHVKPSNPVAYPQSPLCWREGIFQFLWNHTPKEFRRVSGHWRKAVAGWEGFQARERLKWDNFLLLWCRLETFWFSGVRCGELLCILFTSGATWEAICWLLTLLHRCHKCLLLFCFCLLFKDVEVS